MARVDCFSPNNEYLSTRLECYNNVTNKWALFTVDNHDSGDIYYTITTPPSMSVGPSLLNYGWFLKQDAALKVCKEFVYDSNSGGFLKVYNNGWIEQGGYISSTATGDSYVTINLWRPFSKTKYFVMNQHEQTAYTGDWGSGCASIHTSNKKTTSFELSVDGCANTSSYYWMAYGL